MQLAGQAGGTADDQRTDRHAFADYGRHDEKIIGIGGLAVRIGDRDGLFINVEILLPAGRRNKITDQFAARFDPPGLYDLAVAIHQGQHIALLQRGIVVGYIRKAHGRILPVRTAKISKQAGKLFLNITDRIPLEIACFIEVDETAEDGQDDGKDEDEPQRDPKTDAVKKINKPIPGRLEYLRDRIKKVHGSIAPDRAGDNRRRVWFQSI